MTYYINNLSKRIVTRNNGAPSKCIKIFNHTTDSLEFSVVDSNNQLLDIPAGNYYLVGSYVKQKAVTTIFFTADFEIVGKVLKLNYTTNTYQFLDLIKGENVQIVIEVGYKDSDGEHVLLQDYAYASQRYYIDGMPTPQDVSQYFTKLQTIEAINAALSGLDFATEEYVDEAVATKQDKITEDEKLSYSLLSGTPTIPTKTSDLDNDSGFITSEALSGKQDKITEDSRLSYSLLSGTPSIPTKTSELTNDSDFQTGSEVQAVVSGKQDTIDANNKLAYSLLSGTPSIPTKTSDLVNDSDFQTGSEVQAAVSGKQDTIDANNKLAYSLLSGTPSIPTKTSELTNDSDFATTSDVQAAVSGKQDIIDANNKLAYSLLSGTPAIPTKTSDLTNDSDFATTSDITSAVSGKLDKADYIEPYNLPANAGTASSWLGQASAAWTDSSIIANDKKIEIIGFTDETYMNFPTIAASADETNVRTCEIWIKMAGDEATGITSIYTPATYTVIDSDNFPTVLKGEATNGESYSYHIFVMRFIPKQAGCYVALNYSHCFSTNGNY